MNDRPTPGGGKEMLTIQVPPSVSDRLPDIHVSEIDCDSAFRTITYTLGTLRAGCQWSASCRTVSKADLDAPFFQSLQ